MAVSGLSDTEVLGDVDNQLADGSMTVPGAFTMNILCRAADGGSASQHDITNSGYPFHCAAKCNESIVLSGICSTPRLMTELTVPVFKPASLRDLHNTLPAVDLDSDDMFSECGDDSIVDPDFVPDTSSLSDASDDSHSSSYDTIGQHIVVPDSNNNDVNRSSAVYATGDSSITIRNASTANCVCDEVAEMPMSDLTEQPLAASGTYGTATADIGDSLLSAESADTLQDATRNTQIVASMTDNCTGRKYDNILAIISLLMWPMYHQKFSFAASNNFAIMQVITQIS